MTEKLATVLALDVTTTEFAVAVRDESGVEGYASLPMDGVTAWNDDDAFPGFCLGAMPGMLQKLLGQLQTDGWSFAQPGLVSVSCRQHDQVILDKEDTPLTPAISWQCNAATAEVQQLKAKGVEASVGTIEPRFVLPKLLCVLNRDESLRDQVATVFMTGDWMAYKLTGVKSLAKSDALSNGLLVQATRERADDAIRTAGLNPDWFPPAVPSGAKVGVVGQDGTPEDAEWKPTVDLLRGWTFAAGLGDNHASAVGCGMKADYGTMVISAGTSGTINLSCPKEAKLPAGTSSLQFEFYENDLLLLLMLGDCGAWYNRFVAQYAADHKSNLDELNQQALASDLTAIRRVLHDDGQHVEDFAPGWQSATLGEKVASTQFSIMLELLLRVKRMLGEVAAAESAEGVPSVNVQTFVLTGGLSQSLLFQHVFYTGIQLLAPGAAAKVSGRTGPLRYKTSAYGALINAELPELKTVTAIHEDTSGPDRFPLKDCAAPTPETQASLAYLLRSYGI